MFLVFFSDRVRLELFLASPLDFVVLEDPKKILELFLVPRVFPPFSFVGGVAPPLLLGFPFLALFVFDSFLRLLRFAVLGRLEGLLVGLITRI